MARFAPPGGETSSSIRRRDRSSYVTLGQSRCLGGTVISCAWSVRTSDICKRGTSALVAFALVASSISATAEAATAAENLLLTSVVRNALVHSGASHYGLAGSAFTGLVQGTAYYALRHLHLHDWAGASLIPSSSSYEAQVAVQDDGAYLIFDRTALGAWQVHDVGYSDTVR